ncbi:MAG: bifunctional glycosyltransferase/class I SAM-dependent methyltransferase [bacterium]|nr:bifunctional glycosyltransferase/class I SAM-dependent methyltransferase [bacterium]
MRFPSPIRTITIIVPSFNEIRTIARIYDALVRLRLAVDNNEIEKSILFVDDGSTDGTREWITHTLADARCDGSIRLLTHPTNRGKGAAIRTALEHAHGDYIIIQDADLEYDPQDIQTLVTAAHLTHAPAIYGSRDKDIVNACSSKTFLWGNRILTLLTNLLFRQRLTDVETCYKLINTQLYTFLDLREHGFGTEIEVTAKIATLGITIPEVSITYTPRSYHEGKKIRVRDGVRAVLLLVKYRVSDLHYGPLDLCIRAWRERALWRVFAPHASATVLDVGCGRQASLAWKLRTRVSTYTGVDPDVRPAQYRNVRILRTPAEQMVAQLDGETFDTIIALAVLEHLDDPDHFLHECRTLLKNNGCLILTTPTPRAQPILHLLAFLRLIDAHEIEEHKTLFHPRELHEMLRRAGYSSVRVRPFLFGYNCCYVATR